MCIRDSPTPSPGAPAPDLPVLGSLTSSDGDTPVQVDLNEVRASGRVLTIVVTARNLLPDTARSNWQIADFFSDGIYQKRPDGTPDSGLTADGIYVIDPANAKRYLVARDPQGECVCSQNLASTFVNAGKGVVLTAVLGAPPALALIHI